MDECAGCGSRGEVHRDWCSDRGANQPTDSDIRNRCNLHLGIFSPLRWGEYCDRPRTSVVYGAFYAGNIEQVCGYHGRVLADHEAAMHAAGCR